jgi:glycerophosphoryl diester phosphodiesterase
MNERILKEVSRYANAIGPHKQELSARPYAAAAKLVDTAHLLGMHVHPYTSRSDRDVDPAFHGTGNDA